MSFPRYPSYKDSGVEWLGEVPEHWSVEPFKRQIERNDGGVWGDDPDGLNDTIVLRSTEQTVDGRWQLDDPAPRKLTEVEIDGSLLVEGDLLLTKSSGSSLHIGKTTLVTPEIAAMRCCYSNFMQRIRTRPSFSPKLAWHVLNNDLARRQFDLLSNSTTGLANLNGTMIGQIIVPVPPLPEQTQIAAFLDRETAKIDELVTEQRRLMDLLKEKRQAVISHAVTEGLNPDAPVKPSGIEWLGDVPAHWDVRKLKFLCDVQTGDKDTENAVEDGLYPFFVRSQTVERINSTAFDCEAILTAGDGVGVGKVFHYHNGPFDFHQRVYMMNNFREVSGPYLFHFFRENFYKVALEGGAKSTVDSLRRPVFMNFTVCVPPKAEQAAIVTTVEREAEKFDTLTAEAQRAIDLLQERRTALISAAVTGQIDVRHLTEKEAA